MLRFFVEGVKYNENAAVRYMVIRTREFNIQYSTYLFLSNFVRYSIPIRKQCTGHHPLNTAWKSIKLKLHMQRSIEKGNSQYLSV